MLPSVWETKHLKTKYLLSQNNKWHIPRTCAIQRYDGIDHMAWHGPHLPVETKLCQKPICGHGGGGGWPRLFKSLHSYPVFCGLIVLQRRNWPLDTKTNPILGYFMHDFCSVTLCLMLHLHLVPLAQICRISYMFCEVTCFVVLHDLLWHYTFSWCYTFCNHLRCMMLCYFERYAFVQCSLRAVTFCSCTMCV
jgi:hypothetical protein